MEELPGKEWGQNCKMQNKYKFSMKKKIPLPKMQISTKAIQDERSPRSNVYGVELLRLNVLQKWMIMQMMIMQS